MTHHQTHRSHHSDDQPRRMNGMFVSYNLSGRSLGRQATSRGLRVVVKPRSGSVHLAPAQLEGRGVCKPVGHHSHDQPRRVNGTFISYNLSGRSLGRDATSHGLRVVVKPGSGSVHLAPA